MRGARDLDKVQNSEFEDAAWLVLTPVWSFVEYTQHSHKSVRHSRVPTRDMHSKSSDFHTDGKYLAEY